MTGGRAASQLKRKRKEARGDVALQVGNTRFAHTPCSGHFRNRIQNVPYTLYPFSHFLFLTNKNSYVAVRGEFSSGLHWGCEKERRDATDRGLGD